MKTSATKASARKTRGSAPNKVIAKMRKKSPSEPSADAFMALLDHPLKADFEAVRKAILSVDKSITDGVKWNSLSFRTTDWFATANLRSRNTVQLVLHLGAKVGKQAAADVIPDPKGLLKWLGKDRAIASLGAGSTLKGNLPALKAIIKPWVAAL